MFIGHFAVGFAAKRAAPRASLGWLMAAPLLLDLILPALVLAGVERVEIDPGNTAFTPLAFVHYPITHSLVMAIAWAALAGGLYWTATRYRVGAVVIALGVVSHWFFDAIVHRPDLPLYPGSGTYVGLGLWNSIAGTVIVEGSLFAAGVWTYVASTRGRDRTGVVALWAFIGLLVAIYAANIAGPPPPSARAVAVVGLATWIFPLWAWWFDRHRTASPAEHAVLIDGPDT
jgi:membrane-bound metal-dependent hydrolase YbcI (DUF457 family)